MDGIPAGDRGLAFGDGVFRTIAVRGGRALNWNWHWRRLALDCATLGLPVPEEPVLLDEIAKVAPRDATVKAILTRGVSARGYGIAAPIHPTRIVAAYPPAAYPPEHGTQGVRVRRCALTLSQQPRLAGAKTLNRLENVLARSEWDDPSIAEGLLADSEGRVIEGTMSNVFVAAAGRVRTPSLARCGIIGAQRERIRDLLRAEGIACAECDLRWADLESAHEIFLTNSLIGVWPVRQLEARTLEPGPIAVRLQRLLERDDGVH